MLDTSEGAVPIVTQENGAPGGVQGRACVATLVALAVVQRETVRPGLGHGQQEGQRGRAQGRLFCGGTGGLGAGCWVLQASMGTQEPGEAGGSGPGIQLGLAE